jgi:hypothetical protein
MTEFTGEHTKIIARAETKRAKPAEIDFTGELRVSFQKTRPYGSFNGKPQATAFMAQSPFARGLLIS